MNNEVDVEYRRCLSCGWIHEIVPPINNKDDMKHSHCCNCFEDYLNFGEASITEVVNFKSRHKNVGKILMP